MKLMIPLVILCLGGTLLWADDAPKSIAVKEPELRNELLRRAKVDQEAREVWAQWLKTNGISQLPSLSKQQQAEFEKLLAKMNEVDKDNTNWLKDVIQKHGWPTRSQVGEDGADAAWLLAQHADADPKFQRDCLKRVTNLPKQEVSQSKMAYLTDRVLLAEGKKQLYGTQFNSVDGKWKVRPLEDPVNVDKRRAEVDLPPLAEYILQIEQQFGTAGK